MPKHLAEGNRFALFGSERRSSNSGRMCGVSERRACTVIDHPRIGQRFNAKPRTDEASLMKRMLQLRKAKPRYGYRRSGWLLREEGWRAGLSRVFRLWQRNGLKVPVKRRTKRRLGASANGWHRQRAEAPNDVWCWDFVFDRTASGSQVKWLSVVDEYTLKCLPLKDDRGITSEDVSDTLSKLFAMRGVPRHIRSDNGPEFIAQTLRRWLTLVGVGTLYIEPGSPLENGCAESSRDRLRKSASLWRCLRAPGMSGRSLLLGKRNTTPSGVTTTLSYHSPAAFAAACGEAPCS